MKVIVTAVAFLALLPAAQSGLDEKKIVFLSLNEKPSEWLSDKPMDLFVNPFGKAYEMQNTEGFLILKKYPATRPSNSMPLLDFPGPGYHGKKGIFSE